MFSITEYLLSKSKFSKVLYATDENVYQIVRDEITKLGNNADLNHIDVSQVTDMTALFSPFEDDLHPKALGDKFIDINPDISEWDTSSVRTMDAMFRGARKFNCDLSKWDVSNVEDMQYMFCNARSFDGDISAWDVMSTKNFRGMFSHALKFNCDISKWDIRNAQDMTYMFYDCKAFDQDLSSWAVSTYCEYSDVFTYCHNMTKEKMPRIIRP